MDTWNETFQTVSFKQVNTTHISLRYEVFDGWMDGWKQLCEYVVRDSQVPTRLHQLHCPVTTFITYT